MKKLTIFAVLILGSTTAAVSQEKCLSEKDIQRYVKQHRMAETRWYWNEVVPVSETGA